MIVKFSKISAWSLRLSNATRLHMSPRAAGVSSIVSDSLTLRGNQRIIQVTSSNIGTNLNMEL